MNGHRNTDPRARSATSVARPARGLLGTLCGLLLALFVGLPALSPSLAHAEPPEGAETQADRDALREKVIEKVRIARREYMKAELDLDDSTADALDAILETYTTDRMKAQEQVRKARQALVTALESDASDEELGALEQTFHTASVDAAAVRTGVFDATRKVLTGGQQARLHVALPAFERKVQRKLKKARKKARKIRGERGGGIAPGRKEANPLRPRKNKKKRQLRRDNKREKREKREKRQERRETD